MNTMKYKHSCIISGQFDQEDLGSNTRNIAFSLNNLAKDSEMLFVRVTFKNIETALKIIEINVPFL